MQEEFRDIKGYEGIYQVSNLGRVKSLISNKILKPVVASYYYVVCLVKNHKRKTYYIHRLVAETFLENPENLPCVNHRDENKLNNIISNLEFCTYSYNNTYNNVHLSRANKLSKPILQYDIDGNFIKEHCSLQSAYRNLGISEGNIWSVLVGKRKTAGGFIWKYKE